MSFGGLRICNLAVSRGCGFVNLLFRGVAVSQTCRFAACGPSKGFLRTRRNRHTNLTCSILYVDPRTKNQDLNCQHTCTTGNLRNELEPRETNRTNCNGSEPQLAARSGEPANLTNCKEESKRTDLLQPEIYNDVPVALNSV
jgi:hypothetical protein